VVFADGEMGGEICACLRPVIQAVDPQNQLYTVQGIDGGL
jgi:hypothetical protein